MTAEEVVEIRKSFCDLLWSKVIQGPVGVAFHIGKTAVTRECSRVWVTGSDHMKPRMRQDGQVTIREVLLKKINLNFIIPLCLATPLIGHTLRKRSLMTPWGSHLPKSECEDSTGQVVHILPTSLQQPVGKSKTTEEPSTFYRYCLDSDSNYLAVEGFTEIIKTIWVWTVYWTMWRNMLILGVFMAW